MFEPTNTCLSVKVFYLPWLVNFAGPNYGLILELDRNGYITRSFQDPTGSVVPRHISEVYDDGNVLYLGCYHISRFLLRVTWLPIILSSVFFYQKLCEPHPHSYTCPSFRFQRTVTGVTGMLITLFLLILSALDVLFFFLPNSNFDPKAVSVFEKTRPKFEGALKVNSILAKTQKWHEGDLVGPESIAADSTGTLYAGLADGRIVKLEGDKVVDVVRTGKQMANCGTPEAEPTCGRPLGMRFDKYGINLIVADAYLGLLEVNPKARTVSTLVPPSPGMNNRPFRFVNDLDIARDRTIYFTDSSSKWQRRQLHYSILEGDNTGRLMAYHPKTGEMEVLMDGLHFANGVQISPDGDHVLVAETGALRIMKYYIKGEHEGKSEVFAQNLPGFPDNIRLSSKGGYWVGIATVRTDFFDLFQLYPRAKSFTAKVFSLPWLIGKTSRNYGLLLELDENGHITRSFHDPTGSVIPGSLSEVHDDGDVLFFGSFRSPFVGRLELKD
ncbi:unnamed protein product [Pocillopora meandrina]|uniref:Strictosidine synthase conserved region domain-containing protein n=1 Tax=Pocillopora meandrina TaxID=46732 RepID=A0AAU9W1M2_9CNID|nr:unnamed protein product [Pocillopora meandrina]